LPVRHVPDFDWLVCYDTRKRTQLVWEKPSAEATEAEGAPNAPYLSLKGMPTVFQPGTTILPEPMDGPLVRVQSIHLDTDWESLCSHSRAIYSVNSGSKAARCSRYAP
jgi:hypothetical protein